MKRPRRIAAVIGFALLVLSLGRGAGAQGMASVGARQAKAADTTAVAKDARLLSAASIDVADRDEKPIRLNGRWKFKLGDDPLWMSSTIDDSKWAELDPGQPLPDSLVRIVRDLERRGVAPIGWFRLHLTIDPSLLGHPLSLDIASPGASEVFVGGDVLLSLGDPDTLAHGRTTLAPAPVVFDRRAAVVAVRIQLGSVIRNEDNNTPFSLWILPPAAVVKNRVAEAWAFEKLVGIGAILATLALLHFLLYALVRRPRGNLYFGVFGLCMSVGYFGLVMALSRSLIASSEWWHAAHTASICLSLVAIVAFLHSTFYGRLRWPVAVVAVVGAFAVLAFVVPSNHIRPGTDPRWKQIAFSLLTVLAAAEGVRVIAASLWKRRPGARILGAGYTLAFIGLAYFVGTTVGLLPAAPFDVATPSLLAIALSSSVYLSVSFAKATIGFEKLSLHLEEQVVERTVQLREAKAQADAANETKSQFLANMSHELRTPLNAIIGYSEMLTEEAQDAGDDGYLPDLEKIRGSGKHLLGLINDILDLTKIEAGRMDLFVESVDLAPMIQDVAATIKPLLDKNQNTLKLDVAPNIGTIRGDQLKLRQLLFNLLSNASKFTERGTVTLSARRIDADLELRVCDTGIGMTEEQLSRLFQAFMQAEASTTRKYGGTGLGLAISKRLVDLMGGTIGAESTPGKGTTFTARVPSIDQSPPVTAIAASSPAATIPLDADAATVLIIDDEPTARDMIGRMLGKEGYHVLVATNGPDGIALAQARNPDVITLDIMMGGMDGWSVLSQLKGNPATASIPVVVITIVDDRNLSFALGASDYLTKPIDREQLADVLERVRSRGDEKSVLIVEDDADARRMLRRLFEKEGWAVYEAENGRVGLDAVTAHAPGLVLLDLMMPEMDGFDFIDHLRRRPDAANLPVVVLTAKDLTENDRQRLRGSVERVMQKSGNTMEVVDEVRRVLERRSRTETGIN